MGMKWVYNDGGREEAGFKGTTRDCVTRAIAIATEKPYKEIYDLINTFGKNEKPTILWKRGDNGPEKVVKRSGENRKYKAICCRKIIWQDLGEIFHHLVLEDREKIH